MLRQKCLVNARLLIETVDVAGRYEVDQIAIAFLVFAQQDQMVVAIARVLHRGCLLRHIHLATDDWVDSRALGRVIEFDSAKQIAVVGHRDGGSLLLCHHLHHLTDLAGTVEQRIVGVAVEVNKRCFVAHGEPSF